MNLKRRRASVAVTPVADGGGAEEEEAEEEVSPHEKDKLPYDPRCQGLLSAFSTPTLEEKVIAASARSNILSQGVRGFAVAICVTHSTQDD